MRQNIKPVIENQQIILMKDIVYSQGFTYFGKRPRALEMLMLRPIDWWEETGRFVKRPTIVWVVGGAWRETFPSARMAEFAYLAYAGYNVVSIDYRVSNEATFPCSVQDAKTAIRFLRSNADKYGVDPERIAIMGDSAGGYLAAMVGASEGVEEFETSEWAGVSSAVRAVVDWYGPVDLWKLQEHPGEIFVGTDEMEMMIKSFMGCAIIPENYAKIQQASVIHYLSHNAPPYLILHGTEDEMIPYDQSELLYDALCAKGVEANLYLVEGAKHCSLEFSQPQIQRLILDFLDKHMK